MNILKRFAAITVSLAPIVLLPLGGCTEYKPDYQTQPPVAPRATPRPIGTVEAAPSDKVVEGAVFNKMFPPNGDGYVVTYTQEKKGFAQAELTQGGKKLAILSLSDTLANPSARAKFAKPNGMVNGFPSANVGENGTAILVRDRFQIQVRSSDPTFDASERAGWIVRFNLPALKKLAGG